MRSSFGRVDERDVDRTDSSGEGGTVASEKRTVVGVAEERTVWEESSMGGGGGGAEKRRRVRGDVASACRRARAYNCSSSPTFRQNWTSVYFDMIGCSCFTSVLALWPTRTVFMTNEWQTRAVFWPS